MADTVRTPVLIAGGSIVGLSLAAFLAANGVTPVLVERRRQPSRRLRAKVLYARTMELYRTIGLEDGILAGEPSGVPPAEVAIVESLAGRELRRWKIPAAVDLGDLSPSRSAFVKQRDVEVLLRVRAQELGADLRFSTELEAFEQDHEGVTARIRNHDTNEDTVVRADYLVAADGGQSMIRRCLDIGQVGLGALSHEMDIGFAADLGPIVRGRPLAFAHVRRPRLSAYVAWEPSLDAGTVSVTYDPAEEKQHPRFDGEGCLSIVAAALGVPQSAVRVTGTHGWEMASWTAERYRAERVFLVGDAAHVTPPVGGFGANLGVHDAHNLAAKLVQVVRGDATDAILQSYEEERLPVGRLTVDQATLRLADRPGLAERIDARGPLLDEGAITLGYLYRSSAIASDDEVATVAVLPADLDGRPGSRAPHVTIERGGKILSSLDLYRDRIVLVAGPEAKGWAAAASCLVAARRMTMDVLLLGRDFADPGDLFLERHGIGRTGATLIRPDGFVAWRSTGASEAPELVLGSALDRVLGLPSRS